MVKHEAFALPRQRQRPAPVIDDGELGERSIPLEIMHDHAEQMISPHPLIARIERAEAHAHKLATALGLTPEGHRRMRPKREGHRRSCQPSRPASAYGR